MVSRTFEGYLKKVWFEPNTGCWLWPGAMRADGYGTLNVKGKNLKAHRLSYEYFKGPIAHGQNILHACDMPLCVNPDHLRAGSQSDNLDDSYRRSRRARIATNGGRNFKLRFAKLSPDQVSLIKRDKRPAPAVAHDFGVSRTAISNIRTGRTWMDID